ncbi:MAG: glycosyltransferase [Proteobacteria bacterium]|nr:glycosyltransferase [Pseudomonadota bacterium]MBW3616871.1 glycosyltransferase [Pseudomonadota bacterium]
MKLVVFGLTVSSSWGNGHATLWRGLIRALARRGHRVVFFERDVPYYARSRDLRELPGAELVLYADWDAVRSRAACEVREADAAMVTSYCPDARAAAALVQGGRGASVFYDLDTPVTLARLDQGVPYLPLDGLGGFDLVLSYTGGAALEALRDELGARRTAALYGHADPEVHRPAPASGPRADLSYIGTYAQDRQAALEALFIAPARERPDHRFVLAGASYPADFPWTNNIWFKRHLPPAEHPAFFAASRMTLNVTRRDMALMGWAPSGRLFEAASCGTAVLSDRWPGLDAFFEPGREILIAERTEDALAALDRSDAELARIGEAARERLLAEHTSDHRAGELLGLLERAKRAEAVPA